MQVSVYNTFDRRMGENINSFSLKLLRLTRPLLAFMLKLLLVAVLCTEKKNFLFIRHSKVESSFCRRLGRKHDTAESFPTGKNCSGDWT